MWSVYLDANPTRTATTRPLGKVSRRAYYGPLAPLRARSIGKPELPGRHWVRVRNTMAGISGADIARIQMRAERSISLRALPRQSRVYLGREVVGVVTDIGPDVEFLRMGDRVAYQLDPCCATRDIEPPCRHCAAGNHGICENRYLPGPAPIGGGWGDEMLLHERQLFLVPDGLSDEQAALLEPCAVAIHAVLRHQPQPGDNALVIGGGSIGLLTTQVVRALSPNADIAVQARYPFQAEMAQQNGATSILRPEEGMAGVARLTGARRFQRRFAPDLLVGGFDVVYDCVGSEASLQDALRWVRGGGTVVLVGARRAAMRLDMTPLWHQEITLVGATGHGTESWPGSGGVAHWGGDNGGRISTFALAAALIREGRLTPQRLITHRFPLRHIRIAVQTARDRAEHDAIKVLLDIRDVAPTPQEAIPALAAQRSGR